MKKVILVQLPIPQLNFGVKTGNIPLGAACLKSAASGLCHDIEIIPESFASYSCDEAISNFIIEKRPDLVGFTVYGWNIDRATHIAARLKESLNPRIIFGGPEITPDNSRIRKDIADFLVYGEGEAAFLRLLSDESIWEKGALAECSGRIFEQARSPYLMDLLEPGLEEMMLLETQRGCPYRCGYCYYSKSRKNLAFADQKNLALGFEWAMEKSIPEIFLLDPSLDARRGLDDLLNIFAEINKDRKIRISSEIRADMIDPYLADLLEKSGFSGFEMGLQTINPEPLGIMKRKTDLDKFVKGVNLVKERGITPSIDLIIGLPGDTVQGFFRSVDFVEKNGFQDDIQIFPLSVLPGTDFRARSAELGLEYEPDPPYTIRSSPSFSGDDIMECLDYAEECFDVSIYPCPDIDASWHPGDRSLKDISVVLCGKELFRKVVVDDVRSLDDLGKVAERLTHPYQILVKAGIKNKDKIIRALSLLTSINPFTPFEIIFLSPDSMPDPVDIQGACNLRRPHFLDNDLRFLYPDEGNRAYLITLVSSGSTFIEGDMCRNLYLWNHDRLPSRNDLDSFSGYDGIMMDSPAPYSASEEWQDRFCHLFSDLPEITFSDIRLQVRWTLLTRSKSYSGYMLKSLI